LTALLSQSRRLQADLIAVPASRFLCEHLHQNSLFWACISRIHAQVPVVTTGKLTHPLRQQIPCGIDIPIMRRPALGTRPVPLVEPQLIESEPARRAVLARGIPPVDFQEQWAIPVTLVPELPSQFAECGVPYRTGSSPTRETPHIQVFNGDDIKFLHQTSRQSMQRVLAFFSRPRMSTRNSQPLLLTPLAPLLAPCETALLLTQVPQASLIVPGVGDLLPCGEGRQVCKAEVYPYQSARAWAQGAGDLRAEGHVVRPPRIPREGHHVGTLDLRKSLREFHNSELREPQHSGAPARADVLKPKALAGALNLESGLACTLGKEAAESPILIPQALRQARCRHLGQPFVPCCALPQSEPPREIIAGEGESTGAVCFRANLERRVPEPARRSEPAVKESTLRPIGVSAPSIAPRDEAHTLNITSEYSWIAAQTSTFAVGRSASEVSTRAARNGCGLRGRSRR